MTQVQRLTHVISGLANTIWEARTHDEPHVVMCLRGPSLFLLLYKGPLNKKNKTKKGVFFMIYREYKFKHH